VLKNSFRGISRTKFARKLLNLRLPQALKFTQITALVPFSTATPDFNNYSTIQSIVIASLEDGCFRSGAWRD
jgi:hypothetical protein